MTVLLQGMGNSERPWAQLVSRFDKTTLIQQVPIEHVEVWDRGRRLYSGPNERLARWKIQWVLPFMWRAFWNLMRVECRIRVCIAAAPHLTLAALLTKWLGKTEKVVVF